MQRQRHTQPELIKTSSAASRQCWGKSKRQAASAPAQQAAGTGCSRVLLFQTCTDCCCHVGENVRPRTGLLGAGFRVVLALAFAILRPLVLLPVGPLVRLCGGRECPRVTMEGVPKEGDS